MPLASLLEFANRVVAPRFHFVKCAVASLGNTLLEGKECSGASTSNHLIIRGAVISLVIAAIEERNRLPVFGNCWSLCGVEKSC